MHTYDLDLSTPYRWAKGQHDARVGVLVRATVGTGVGWGEAAPSPELEVDLPALQRAGLDLVADLDPATDDVAAAMDERGAPSRLRTAIVTAWLAARADHDGVSLATLLGRPHGRRPADDVAVNTLVTELDPDAAAQRCRDDRATGTTTFKVKCFADEDRDLRRLDAIMAAVPDATLRLDPNEAWGTVTEARRRIDAVVDRHPIEYIEEPIPAGDGWDAYRTLTADSPIPIALDQSVVTPAVAHDIIAAGAADVLILKPPHLGGPDRAVQVIAAADEAGLACTVTASLETSVGIHTALHCAALLAPPVPACGLSTGRFLAHDVAASPLRRGAAFVVPERGLGVAPSTGPGSPPITSTPSAPTPPAPTCLPAQGEPQ